MFTGLIREVGTVMRDVNHKLYIRSEMHPEIGDSIAVNGVCLTVVELLANGFAVEAADETRRIVPSEKMSGNVHLEPAMQMGERFEGHIVQGHVDAIGNIEDIVRGENATEYIISINPEFIDYIIPKGSIAIDGVSLTVNEVWDDRFRLTIIPHTVENTLFKDYKRGDKVNIETDLFARYVGHILSRRQGRKSMGWQDIDAISMSF